MINLFRRIDNWLEHKAATWTGRIPENLDLECRFCDDEFGRIVEMTHGEGLPDKLHAAIHVLTRSGDFVKGRNRYVDGDGNFCLIACFAGNTCEYYIPFGALACTRKGDYLLRVSGFVSDAGNGTPRTVARASFYYPIPHPCAWNEIALFAPLIQLCMMVAWAEGKGEPAKTRCVQNLFVRELKLTSAETQSLYHAIMAPPRVAPCSLLHEISIRLPKLKTRTLLEMLAEVARSDGRVSDAESSLIREIARLRGMTDDYWIAFVEQAGLLVDDSWSVLELSPGASPDEIKSAYRRKMSQCHPDRFALHSREFQELATKQTIAIKQAYERLMAKASQLA